ncbi:PLP-dependent transferase [Pleurotus eryngii]|uniref:PLP-dependent transferase n=1 Tax=Pleurotus eryngii TaxID=5323 RepID=A0A9P6D8G4_PLEER|nr:PLP-dependent transferase [Pleurotus eryngii]
MSDRFHKAPGFTTLQLHTGQEVDIASNAHAPSIDVSTAHIFNDTQASRSYSRTYNQFQITLPRLGISTKFISSPLASIAPPLSSFTAAIDDHTGMIWVESISNPSSSIAPIRELAMIAHEKGIPLIVDNTFETGGKLHPLCILIA